MGSSEEWKAVYLFALYALTDTARCDFFFNALAIVGFLLQFFGGICIQLSNIKRFLNCFGWELI